MNQSELETNTTAEIQENSVKCGEKHARTSHV